MKTISIKLKNENDTLSFGKKLASLLKPTDVVVLTGELGSGKTKLTRNLNTFK